ncbi:MAG TPA: sugar transferase, partial [Anaerolineaceae bacterium]
MTELTKTAKQARKTVAWRVRPEEQRVLLIAGDMVAVAIALVGALYFWVNRPNEWLRVLNWEFIQHRPPVWFYLLPVAWLILLVELYDMHRSHRRGDTFKGVLLAAAIGLAIYLPVYFLSSDPEKLPRLAVVAFIVLAFVFTLVWRNIFISIFSLPRFMRRVLIVGAGRSGTTLLNIVDEIWPPPFYIVGLIDDDDEKKGTKLKSYSVLGGCEDLLGIVQSEAVSDLIFSISGEMSGRMFQAILEAQENGVEVTSMPIFYENTLGRVPIFHLDTDWILRSFVDQAHTSGFYEVFKRLIDILGGLVGSLATLLALPFISAAIVLDTGFPIFFLQNRLGKNGSTYSIIKFRTMRQDSEKDGTVRTTSQNDERITRAGMFLRRSHIDEMPQFFNVLKGE